MKGASLFFVDALVKDPKTGWLVTSPSFSPEQGALCYGPTMDNQLIRSLLDNTTRAAQILNTDSDVAQLQKPATNFAEPNRKQHGQLHECFDDLDAPNHNPRHRWALWALYPGYGHSARRIRNSGTPRSFSRNGAATAAPAGVLPGAFRSGRGSATANTLYGQLTGLLQSAHCRTVPDSRRPVPD